MKRICVIGAITFFILAVACLFPGKRWAAEGSTLRDRVREELDKQFHDDFVALRSEYGLHPFLPAGPGETAAGKGGTVILVHGLDDPGLVWQDLAPALAGEGYRVIVMSYPNDQPVRDSAVFFFRQLQDFTAREGTAPVALVCHSMGGLVTREMMTSPALGYAKAQGQGLVPPVSRFIMIGTPNHGSVFARLRLFTEIRDQLVIGAEKGFNWLRPIVDGLGEAADDLYPGSEFLTELNGRPLPEAGRMLIIAGVMSPVEQRDVAAFLRDLRDGLPEAVRPPSGLNNLIAGIIDQVGDGLVSVESARLPRVQLVEVPGTHLTIIRNFGGSSSRVPPAIPIVLQAMRQ